MGSTPVEEVDIIDARTMVRGIEVRTHRMVLETMTERVVNPLSNEPLLPVFKVFADCMVSFRSW